MQTLESQKMLKDLENMYIDKMQYLGKRLELDMSAIFSALNLEDNKETLDALIDIILVIGELKKWHLTQN